MGRYSASKQIRPINQGDILNVKISVAARENNIKFTIANERFCQDRSFDILIYIFSAVKNIDQRLAIRASWGDSTVLKGVAKIIYIIGRTSDMDTQKLVEDESNRFKDIVQGDFEDSYFNLPNKSVTALNWIRKYCNSVKVLIKTDDDLALDIERIIKSVYPYLNQSRHIMCSLFKHGPVVRNEGNKKFYVPVDEFPDKVYPVYCNGWVYMYTADIVEELCQSMAQTERFKIEDVWTTGIVMSKLKNLTRIHMPMLFGNRKAHNVAAIHRIRASLMKNFTLKAIEMRNDYI